MPILHKFVNPKADGVDPTVTKPSDWNAVHNKDEAVTNASGNYQVQTTDELILVTGSGTITLTDATQLGGPYIIKNVGVGAPQVVGLFGQTVDGFPAYDLANNNQGARFSRDGLNWQVTGQFGT